MEIKKVVVLCAAITTTACFITGLLIYFWVTSKERGNEIKIGTGNYNDISKYMEISDLERLIDRNFITEADKNNLVEGALKGMVSSLNDPYSIYFTEEEYADYSASSEGTHVGIGAQLAPISNNTGYLKVVSVLKGSPAESGGIYANDIITEVDDIDLRNIDYESAIHMVMGPSGSTVNLKVSTGDYTRGVPLIRANMQIPYVNYYMLDDKIGVIIITDFRPESVDEFSESLKKLIEEEEAQAIIIDLRDNIGTSIKSAVDILDQIMPDGILTYSINNLEERTEYVAKGGYNDVPIAVLVNGATASAAEIFAGSVKDGQRGSIIGTKTFGKGVGQTVLEMPYSGGAVKLTTDEFYTPSGTKINGIGIEPDSTVEMPADLTNLTAETDTQLQAAKQALYEVN